ncbi:MAG: alpha/beta fold hydrolase, partial [Steroidobacteraceae bacterium]|nr:alpha/beta fold hydrolase [Steroidobacteraceae bacterium]MDW8258168.1 alpha/beta fold hydrolase [Gammaproteobacteria bacterium]
NLRDHGGTHHLNEGLFHSCRLPEVIGAVREIQAALPALPLYLAGFSLGGNFLLRVAAAAAAHGLRLQKTVAVSPVLDPARSLDAMENGLGLYRRYFVFKWARSLVKKQAAWPQRYDFTDVLRTRSLRAMTDMLIRRYTEYPDLDTYLAGYAVTGERLASLTTPATILLASDDPIVPWQDLDRLSCAGPLRIRLTAKGGHCAYLTDFAGPSWVDAAIEAEFAAA